MKYCAWYCGIIGVEFAGNCVLELMKQEKEDQGHRAVFLAAQCLQEIREVAQVREPRRQVRGSAS